jgi:hypothetical protein
MTTKHHVIAEFHKNPSATSTEIADKLDCDPAYVRATLRRNGLKLAGSIGRTDYRSRKGILALGHAAKAAGLTVGDIERLSEGMAR